MSDTWHTYTTAAAALGMTPESIRQRARRESWRRTIGNDGKARIMLPEDTVRIPAGDTPSDPPGDPPASRPRHRPVAKSQDAALAILAKQVERLEGELERALERAKQADILEAVLAAERAHADELRQDRDRWAVQAHALAHPPVPARPEPRGVFGWVRRLAG